MILVNCAKFQQDWTTLILGGIRQLRGQNFAIFDTHTLRGQFLYPDRGQKQTFFDPLHLVHVVF